MIQNYEEYSGIVPRKIKELYGIYYDAVKRLYVSDSEFWIWYTLVAVEGKHTQQDICSMWSLPKQTVNTIVTRLRLKKYAYLEAVSGTRNRKVICLTDAGREYGEKLILPITQAEKKAYAKLSPEEIILMTDLLNRYINSVKDSIDNIEK